MTTTRTRLAAVGVAACLAGGTAGVAAAARDEAPAGQFQTRLAEELGVSPGKLRAATERAAKGTVGALRASGRIDAERAERLTRQAERGRALPFTRMGETRRRGGLRRAGLDALGTALGTDRRTLAGLLREGKAPAEVIAARGGDRAAAEQAVRAAVRAKLDRRVKAGRLPAEKADDRAAEVAARLTGDEPLRGAKRSN